MPSATSTPTTRTSWCGFGSLQALHRRKVTADARCVKGSWRPARAGGAARPASSFFEKPGSSSKRVERALAELGELQLGVGDHAGVARRAVEQGEVAEEAARRRASPPRGRGARPGPGPRGSRRTRCPAAPSVTTTLPAGTVDPVGRLRHQSAAPSWSRRRTADVAEGVDEGIGRVAIRRNANPDGQVCGNALAEIES